MTLEKSSNNGLTTICKIDQDESSNNKTLAPMLAFFVMITIE